MIHPNPYIENVDLIQNDIIKTLKDLPNVTSIYEVPETLEGITHCISFSKYSYKIKSLEESVWSYDTLTLKDGKWMLNHIYPMLLATSYENCMECLKQVCQNLLNKVTDDDFYTASIIVSLIFDYDLFTIPDEVQRKMYELQTLHIKYYVDELLKRKNDYDEYQKLLDLRYQKVLL